MNKETINENNLSQQHNVAEPERKEQSREARPTPARTTAILKRSMLIYGAVLIAVVCFTAGLIVGTRTCATECASTQQVMNREEGMPERVDFALFWDVWNKLNKKHVDRPFDKQELLYGAIKGMVAASEDPYSGFLDPEETKLFNSQIEGKFEGIGAEIGMRGNMLTIVSPLPESPAERAGVKAQDQVLKVDDKIIDGMSVDEAVQLIRGPKGSIVKLTIYRPSTKETLELSITRETIHVDSVKLEFIDENIAHLQIRSFGNGTVQEINDAADEILNRNARGIIIDVRNNPGGLLDVAINVASLFMENGKIVVIEDKGNGNRHEFESSRNNKLKNVPTVILQNEGSASASEIIAGALRDIRNTPIIGMKSFGKGSVQDYELLPVKDIGDASLRTTIAKWLTPNGTSIHDNGIEPDITVELTEDDMNNDRDPQLDRAIEEVKR